MVMDARVDFLLLHTRLQVSYGGPAVGRDDLDLRSRN